MPEIICSIIIPSYRDPLLNKTIEDLLKKSELGDKLEIIAVYDGYWGTPIADPRVRYVHLGKNRGMRGAINAGVAVSRGKYICRMDEHQMVGQGCDRILVESCQDNWIITPRRYFLDPVKWEVMKDEGFVDTMKLDIRGGKFTGVGWDRNDDKQPIQESMAMQGSMWLMPRKWWDDVIGELQTEGYGPLIQDSHEMVFKTWKEGGKLMVNKNTWHAHKHRSFKRTHNNGTPENPAKCEEGYAYALATWETYYRQVIMPKWNL